MTIGGHSPSPVVCFDFDGTLVDAEGHIHPSDVAILKANSSITFVPAPGARCTRYGARWDATGSSWTARSPFR